MAADPNDPRKNIPRGQLRVTGLEPVTGQRFVVQDFGYEHYDAYRLADSVNSRRQSSADVAYYVHDHECQLRGPTDLAIMPERRIGVSRASA